MSSNTNFGEWNCSNTLASSQPGYRRADSDLASTPPNIIDRGDPADQKSSDCLGFYRSSQPGLMRAGDNSALDLPVSTLPSTGDMGDQADRKGLGDLSRDTRLQPSDCLGYYRSSQPGLKRAGHNPALEQLDSTLPRDGGDQADRKGLVDLSRDTQLQSSDCLGYYRSSQPAFIEAGDNCASDNCAQDLPVSTLPSTGDIGGEADRKGLGDLSRDTRLQPSDCLGYYRSSQPGLKRAGHNSALDQLDCTLPRDGGDQADRKGLRDLSRDTQLKPSDCVGYYRSSQPVFTKAGDNCAGDNHCAGDNYAGDNCAGDKCAQDLPVSTLPSTGDIGDQADRKGLGDLSRDTQLQPSDCLGYYRSSQPGSVRAGDNCAGDQLVSTQPRDSGDQADRKGLEDLSRLTLLHSPAAHSPVPKLGYWSCSLQLSPSKSLLNPNAQEFFPSSASNTFVKNVVLPVPQDSLGPNKLPNNPENIKDWSGFRKQLTAFHHVHSYRYEIFS